MILIILSIVSIHLIVTVLLTGIIGHWKSSNHSLQPGISVVIAARNEWENLQILLPKLLAQDYPDYEIIIGLDRCTDESLNYLENHSDPSVTWIDIKEVPVDWDTKKYALHQATCKATREWLVFTDGDCCPTSTHWLTSVAKEADPSTDIIIGMSPYQSTGTWLSKYVQFEAFMTALLYASFTLLKKPYMAVGRNLAIKKSFFLTCGGYKEFKNIRGGDDDLFIQRNAHPENTRLMLGHDSVVSSMPLRTWKAYFEQKIRHFSVSKYYANSHQLLITGYHISHFASVCGLVYFIYHPYIIPILLFYLFIKLGSYRFAMDKMGMKFNYMFLPIVDMMYAIFTPVLGIWSKLKKDIKWKN